MCCSVIENFQRKYCRYCFYRIDVTEMATEKIFERYLHLNRSVDDEDVRLMKKLVRNHYLCPKCFRPYRLRTKDGRIYDPDRYDYVDVLIESISYWMFIVCLWWPLLIIFCIPAMITMFLSWVCDNLCIR